MATLVRARDVARHESENVKQDFAIAVAQLTLAIQALATKLDADASVADENYASTLSAIMTYTVVS